MGTTHKGMSPFDQGRIAGTDQSGPLVPNPFEEGSREHHNFEVGRRSGAAMPSRRVLDRGPPQAASAGEDS